MRGLSPNMRTIRMALFLFTVSILTAIYFKPQPALAQDSTDGSSKSIRSVLQPFVDSHSLAGAVLLVADKDKVLDVETVGYADIASNKLMPVDAFFWIASMSKP